MNSINKVMLTFDTLFSRITQIINIILKFTNYTKYEIMFILCKL